MHLFMHLFIHAFIHSFSCIYLFIYLFIYAFVYLLAHLFVCHLPAGTNRLLTSQTLTFSGVITYYRTNPAAPDVTFWFSTLEMKCRDIKFSPSVSALLSRFLGLRRKETHFLTPFEVFGQKLTSFDWHTAVESCVEIIKYL